MWSPPSSRAWRRSRFAFDLELFVVARYPGFTRFFEAPVTISASVPAHDFYPLRLWDDSRHPCDLLPAPRHALLRRDDPGGGVSNGNLDCPSPPVVTPSEHTHPKLEGPGPPDRRRSRGLHARGRPCVGRSGVRRDVVRFDGRWATDSGGRGRGSGGASRGAARRLLRGSAVLPNSTCSLLRPCHRRDQHTSFPRTEVRVRHEGGCARSPGGPRCVVLRERYRARRLRTFCR